MCHHWLVFSSEELQLGWRENSKLFKAAFSCLKVELDFLVLLNVLSRYFEVPYSLCRFFGGVVSRRVWELVWIEAWWWLQGAWCQELWGEFCNCFPDPGWISQSFCFLLWNCRQIMSRFKGKPSHPVGGNVNWYSQSGRQCGGSPQKWNIEQPRDPAIALLGNYPKDTKMQIRRGYMHHDVYSSNVHSNQTVERIPKSMHWWVDKADGGYLYIMEYDPASKRMKSYPLQGCGWI